MQLWSKGTHGLGGPTPGAKRCLWSLDTLRKRTGKLMATERQVLEIADELVKSVERAVDLPDDSEPVPTTLGRSGQDASVGRTVEWRLAHPSSSGGAAGSAETWRMAHLPSSDEDDGSKQQVWTTTLKALRHLAAGKKLLERGFTTHWDNRKASKARAFRKKVDEHTDQSLVDYLATQVTVNGEWKARDKKDGEITRAQWEDLVPQAREWLDEQNPTKQASMLHVDSLSSVATGIFLAHPRNLGKILEMRSSRPLAAVVPGTVDRVKETYAGSVSLEMSPTTLVVQYKGTNRSHHVDPVGRHQN